MLTNEPYSGLSPDELPMIEVWLDIGEALRLGNSVLRVVDTDDEDVMLRVEPAAAENADETRWAELPR